MKAILSPCVLVALFAVLPAQDPTRIEPVSQELSRRPNILFAIADDWGWPHAGAYGDKVIETPTFDRIAREGVLFEAAFVSSPSCTPSRNAILTGQDFFRLGEGANLWSTLAPEHPVYPLLLEDAGYDVGHWRKAWGPGDWKALGRERNPAGPSYASFDAFLEQKDPDAPFCFWLGAHDPHRGYKPGSGAASGIDPSAIEVPASYPDSQVIREDIADYYFEVQRFDSDVGRALALLEERGQLDNTLVVMTGDHGWPFPRGKTNLYDLGSRVPLAMCWASQIKAGTRIGSPISLVDLAPTFLEAARLEVPEAMTGRGLAPWIAGKAEEDRAAQVVMGRERHTVAQQGHQGGYPMRALRTQDHLLIRNLNPDDWPAGWEAPGGRPFRDCDNGPTKTWIMENRMEHPRAFDLCFGKRPALELYAISSDPFQLTNLATDPDSAEVLEQLQAELDKQLRVRSDPRLGGSEDDVAAFERGKYRGR
ncbi:MAG: N-sulfoglucosamine sulfohydrolase [Planctomycetota bacterium]|jgi:N-sulfoglucosamine sulfohydrolase